jgi:predicted dehydrogenase
MKNGNGKQAAKVRIGIIGCGNRTLDLMKPLVAQFKEVEVAGIFDPNPDSIRKGKEAFGSDTPIFDDYQKLCNQKEIDWVFVGSWNCFHREHVIAAAKAGKHIFCEKPLATTVEDAVAIRDAVEGSDKMFFFGLVLRYSPLYKKVSEVLQSGAIGRIVSMEFNETLNFNHGGFILSDWRRLKKNSGSHLLEKCCHDIDLAHWFSGSLPTAVASFGGLSFFKPENKFHMDRIGVDNQNRTAYRTWRPLNNDPFTSEKNTIDNQVAILEFANGIRATFHTNCNAGIPERRFYILGEEGGLIGEHYSNKLEVRRIGFNEPSSVYQFAGVNGHGGADQVLVENLAQSMIHGDRPAVTAQNGLSSVITCVALDQAMNERQIVNLEKVWEKAGISLAELSKNGSSKSLATSNA